MGRAVPYLRGYGPTSFRSAATVRSGEQAALGEDLRALLDALRIEAAWLGGYDWGGRAACVVAATWPARVEGLVTCNGYNVQDIARALRPATPEAERRLWYQYYFHSERGRAGLAKDRRALCELLWQLWSPTWSFDAATFARTAASFDNADFVDVVIHSYRHRFGLVAGDAACAATEARLALQPVIAVPTIALFGTADGVSPPPASLDAGDHFSGPFEARLIADAGHALPQEAPAAFVRAMLDVRRMRAGV